MKKIQGQEYKEISVHKADKCPYCKNKKIVKNGYRFNHTKKKQRYICKECDRTFVVDDGFKKMKSERELITCCLDLYMNGMSLRKIEAHINQFSQEKITYRSIHNWIIRYAKLLNSFSQSFDLNLSRQYHTDEIFVKCKGEQHYFWDIIDKGTRMLIATHYSEKRDSKSARMLFLKVKNRPLTLFTDGLQGYQKAVRKVFGTLHKDRKVQYIRLRANKDKRNNIVERIQGTIRERIKVMRAFKNKKDAELFLDLFVVYYNFIRVHQGIGMTPIEKAGVELGLGENKWLDLIYRARGL
ncbi:MAG: IS1/IS6 family transposase [Candidatus Pacearchaeota archaeon]|nr:MAG: IS1/IS6 family transposase [Candidatus Pacearchaeota archaeon]